MRLDDDTYLDTSAHAIGEIKLVIKRITEPIKVATEQRTTSVKPPHLQMVHERSKKATAHRVRYVATVASLTLRST